MKYDTELEFYPCRTKEEWDARCKWQKPICDAWWVSLNPKPRIFPHAWGGYVVLYRNPMHRWGCTGGDCTAYGWSPADAYDSWRRAIVEHVR